MHDVQHPAGFLLAMGLLCQIEPGGYVHLGTLCSSFAWINKATHKRSLFFTEGDTSLPHVRLGNALASRTAVLAMLAWCKGVVWSVENPCNSALIQQRDMQFLVRWFAEKEANGWPAGVRRHSVCLGSFGAASRKPVWVYSSDDLTGPLSPPDVVQGSPEEIGCSAGPVAIQPQTLHVCCVSLALAYYL